MADILQTYSNAFLERKCLYFDSVFKKGHTEMPNCQTNLISSGCGVDVNQRKEIMLYHLFWTT